jgi:hypothetical protein
MHEESTRFWSRVDKDGPVPEHRPELGQCWVWTRGTAQAGYGVMGWRGATTTTHRVAWMLSFGPIPNGLHVLHKCDNRLCVNPHHLFLGTQADNARDMWAKGRGSNPPRHGKGGIRRGADSTSAKLTEAAVRDIRARYASGTPQAHLAREYGIRQTTISMIVLRHTWKHLD